MIFQFKETHSNTSLIATCSMCDCRRILPHYLAVAPQQGGIICRYGVKTHNLQALPSRAIPSHTCNNTRVSLHAPTISIDRVSGRPMF